MTCKQMQITYGIVEGSNRGADVIARIGQETYDYYYPLYTLIKSLQKSSLASNWGRKGNDATPVSTGAAEEVVQSKPKKKEKPKSAEEPEKEEPNKKGDLGGTMNALCAVMLDELEQSEEGSEFSAMHFIEDSRKNLEAGVMTMGMFMWMGDAMKK